jgi:DNA-binding transcriptional ArsR family regulator
MAATTLDAPVGTATGMGAAEALELCRVLADPTRFALMAAIWRSEQCVCDLRTSSGDRPQNLVSHHLAVLRRAGIVATRRSGRWIYYRPADDLDPATSVALAALLGDRGCGGRNACTE